MRGMVPQEAQRLEDLQIGVGSRVERLSICQRHSFARFSSARSGKVPRDREDVFALGLAFQGARVSG
jgi:hypothetical protein